ncbi:cytochrome b/b6 domain-containing protein [Shewanella baltica]|uniref:cytochrome b/b6 domain-containing protein n=1 Tax=Shewanella baltica TaxID=62322 RepID=UPI00217D971F|nr:cytochrome b/b6 domain-containing protein [Shewanella baltica]MCS6095441.1 cytochrome b/b6 domain-containing protein [Shewanella baltica]MCS6226549.1 cytochrome b/b6 domain-containing protein [Shewanella baltica]
MMSKLSSLFRVMMAYLHVWIVISSSLLVCASPWIFMGRRIPDNAGFWDYLHVYLGVACAVLGVLFLFSNTLHGKWHQYFGWLTGDWAQLKQDMVGLTKGKFPVAGGKGLFSAIEGIGMLLLVATGITGVVWLLFQGTPTALAWRGYHQIFAQAFIGFLIVHLVLAASHILDFIRQ